MQTKSRERRKIFPPWKERAFARRNILLDFLILTLSAVRAILLYLFSQCRDLRRTNRKHMEELPKYIFRHKTPIQLRFSDVDLFGHVNNTVFFSLYDLAKAEYFKAVLNDMPMKFGVSAVVANINADFIHPVHFDDDIVIETSVARLGRKSFIVSQQAVNAKTNSVVSICRTTMVCYSAKMNDSIEIPEIIRKRITEYEDNILV